MPIDRHDRVLDWKTELLRIAPRMLELPEAARQAVYDAVADFTREDADLALPRLSQAA